MNRYSRLLDLSSFSLDKLKTLQTKKVLLIGVGGVGQTVATYLVTNGIEHLNIVDFDKVEASNLNRQILLTEDDLGKTKVDVVKLALEKRNKNAKITSICDKVNSKNVDELINGYDAVVDAVDNWESKLVIAKACHKAHQLLLHVGVDGNKGQYCLFKDTCLSNLVDESILKAPKDGVMGPMVSVLASLATLDLLRYLSKEHIEIDTLYHFDANTHQLGKVKL